MKKSHGRMKTCSRMLFAVLIAACTLLASCAAGQDELPEQPDGIINLNEYNSQIRADGSYLYFKTDTLSRYNPESGKLTALCADPLCFHDTPECPLYGADTYFFDTDGERVWFFREYFDQTQTDGAAFKREYCVYSIAAGAVSVLLDMSGDEFSPGSSMPMRCGDDIYYVQVASLKGGNPSDNESRMRTLMKMTYDGKKKTEVCELGLVSEPWQSFIGFSSGRMLWFDESKNLLYSTSAADAGALADKGDSAAIIADKKAMTDYIFADGGELIYLRKTDRVEGTVTITDGVLSRDMEIYRCVPCVARAGGSVAVIADIAINSIIEVTEEFVYYMPTIIAEGRETPTDLSLWRLSRESGESECVLTAEVLDGAVTDRVIGEYAYAFYNDGSGGEWVRFSLSDGKRETIFSR